MRKTDLTRKVIQITEWGGDLVFLCDDGSCWRRFAGSPDGWHQMQLPPGCINSRDNI
jgi:hypothetical protein